MGSRGPVGKSGKSKRTGPSKKAESDGPLDRALLSAKATVTERLSEPLEESADPEALVQRLGRGILQRAESIRASLHDAIEEVVPRQGRASRRAKAKPKKKSRLKSAAVSSKKTNSKPARSSSSVAKGAQKASRSSSKKRSNGKVTVAKNAGKKSAPKLGKKSVAVR